MAQFAEQIQAYDTDILYPVLDATGIDGAWDFTINYNALGNLAPLLAELRDRAATRSGAPPAAPAGEPGSQRGPSPSPTPSKSSSG